MKKIILLFFILSFFISFQSMSFAKDLPDLVIEDVKYLVDYWQPGFESFKVRVCNRARAKVDEGGTGDAEHRVKLGYEVNGTDLWGVDDPRLEEINLESEKCVDIITSNNIYLEKGRTYNLTVTIDQYKYQSAPGDILEWKEDNNSYSFSFYMPHESELKRSRGYNLHLQDEIADKCFFRFVRSYEEVPLNYKYFSECLEDNNLSYPENRYVFEDYNCEDRLARTPIGYESIACPENEEIPLISKPDLYKMDWANSVFSQSIENLMVDGIVRGDSNGNFNPDNNITRAQFATIAFNAFGFEKNLEGENFPDVKDNSPHKEDILSLKNYNIIKGKQSGEFDHDGFITRGEAATIVIKAFEAKGVLINVSFDITFPDIYKSVHSTNILKLANIETYELDRIVKGYESGNFGPNDNITRGQSAKIFDISRQVQKNY